MPDILAGLQRDDAGCGMSYRNSISIRYIHASMPRLQRQAVVLSMRITIIWEWEHVLLLSWYEVPVEHGTSDRRI